MKYAFMSFSCPELSFDDMVAAAVEYGYDGLEPRTAANHAHGVELTSTAEERNTFKAKAADSGIALCCLALSSRYADPATVRENMDDTLRYMELAADLGTPRLRVFGGRLGEGVSREEAIDNVSSAMSELVGPAADAGVTICVETHDDWCNPDHVAQIMTNVNHSALAVNWDVMHPVRHEGWTMDSAFERLQPWIQHAHFHDGANQQGRIQYMAMGTGDFDNKRALHLLMNDGFDGYMSGEWINWEPYDVHLPREIAQMKVYEEG